MIKDENIESVTGISLSGIDGGIVVEDSEKVKGD